jgi:hypothetical protein
VRAQWQRYQRLASRIFGILVLLAVVRIVTGLVLAAMADDVSAWGVPATIITVFVVVVCLLVGLAVRLWAPPRRVN